MATIHVPRETAPAEKRVAATPETVKRLVKDGHRVLIEAGAGEASSYPDAHYVAAGAEIAEADAPIRADVVLRVQAPSLGEAESLPEGALLISFLWPLANLTLVRQLAARRVTAFAMDQLPRITRAQPMDALSSQSNVAGYKAVIMAADRMPRLFPLLMTAAGTIMPARVVVLGAGVAGLQAIATARRLGAVVEASDVRPAVREQVESLGGKFIDVPADEDLEGQGGYAREASPEYLQRQRDIVGRHIVAADVVITTALVPGRPAPRLVSSAQVRAMREGSVIVDLAAEQGGNCEETMPGTTVVRHGVTIIGERNVPSLVACTASDMYARNLLAVVQHLYPRGERKLALDDEINDAAIVTHAGEMRHKDVAQALTPPA